MRLSKILSEDQRAVRFCGKRKEMERTEDLVPTVGQPTFKATMENSMGTPRRSVIRPRSELFPNTFQGESDQHQPDGESHLQCIVNPMKPVASAKANSLTGQDSTLGLVRDKEVEMIWRYIYRHKKFNHTTRVPFSESNQNRPCVIVTHKHKKVEDLDRVLDIDFDDIKVTSSEDDIEKILNIGKFNVQNPTIEMMHNLYFVDVDEVPFIDTLRNSFFADWRTLPLGETVMGDYIRFCQDKTATLPRSWMGMALKQTR